MPIDYIPPKKLLPRINPLSEFPCPQKLNLSNYLLDKNIDERKSNKCAILYKDKKITYENLRIMVNKLGNSLKDLGIKNGSRVLIRTPNIPEFIVANLATQKIGAITVPTMMLLKAREISHIANNTEAKAMITSSNLINEVEKASGSLKTIKNIIVIGEEAEGLDKRDYLPYEELVNKGNEKLEAVNIDHDDVALIFHTSATTGPSKGCIHTPEGVLWASYSYGKYCLQVKEDDVIGGHPTMAFTYGYAGLAIIPFLFGVSSSLLADRFTPEKMFETIDKHRITILYSVPTAYRMMLNAIPDAEKKYDLGSLRILVTGGETMGALLFHKLKKMLPHVEILEQIGLTEAFHAICSSRPGKVKPGSMGIEILGYTVRIFDDNGKECLPKDHGYLAFRGPVGCRYWRSPEKQRESVKKGWNYTGDIAWRDEDGFFWFVSRIDDIIKSAAYHVAPHEVEQVLMEHPAVLESAVIGAPDPSRGQRVKAFIVLREGYKPSRDTAEKLKNFVRGKIAAYKAPDKIEFVNEIPKTETQKVRRAELRKVD